MTEASNSSGIHASEPHVLYAEGLASAGYGVPLWDPEPTKGEGEVELGDVGILRDGHFRRLFNILANGGHFWNLRGVPEDFVEHRLGTARIDGPRDLEMSVLHSPSVKVTTAEPDSSRRPTGSQNTRTYKVQLIGHGGSLLVLQGKTVTKSILPDYAFMNYIRGNAQMWQDYARNRLKLQFDEDQLILVTGWTKTTSWQIATFARDSESPASVISWDLISTPGSPPKLVPDSSNNVVVSTRFGPAPTNFPRDLSESPYDPDSPGDQCIFIRGLKVKKRSLFPGFKIYAAAGPHDLSRRRDDYDDAAATFVTPSFVNMRDARSSVPYEEDIWLRFAQKIADSTARVWGSVIDAGIGRENSLLVECM